MTKQHGPVLARTVTFLLLAAVPTAALAKGPTTPAKAGFRERASTWLNPVRYHSSAKGLSLVQYGLENGRRVTLGSTRQIRWSKALPEGGQIQTVYGRLRLDSASHPSRLRTIRTPDGVAKHTLVVRGFNGAEVKRLKAGGFDTSSIKAGTLKVNWQDKDQPYKPLTPLKGVAKVVWGSKLTRAVALTTVLGLSTYTFGLLHTAQAAVSLKLASMATDQKTVRQISTIADFRLRGVPEQRLSTRIPGISEAVSSMQHAAP